MFGFNDGLNSKKVFNFLQINKDAATVWTIDDFAPSSDLYGTHQKAKNQIKNLCHCIQCGEIG